MPPVPQPVYAPPPPPKKALGGGQIALIVGIPLGLVALVIGVCLFAGFAGMAGSDAEAGKDVTITSCSRTSFGNMSVEVSVTNSSDRERSYWITVEFVDGNERLDEGRIYISDVRPGQSARGDTLGSAGSHTGSFRCVVSDVNRF